MDKESINNGIGNQGQYTNYAFISYKREDEKWAKWLQRKLESYKLPVVIREEINKTNICTMCLSVILRKTKR